MKYEFKGTPGEWEVEHDTSGDDYDDSRWPWKILSGKEDVVFIDDCSDEDANLISAAPDLLMAAIAYLEEYEFVHSGHHSPVQQALKKAVHKALNIEQL